MLAVPATVMGDGYRGWMYDGQEEPNVPGWDDDPTFMRQSANQEAVDQIFFDAFWDKRTSPFLTSARTEDT
ncbi:MAG: hypothetical protein R3185_04815, partial [Candidatus Thermoplasmatota archaeon]|nr:hypothetical protein [Candidatus Thermoplasmatota archaeon]